MSIHQVEQSDGTTISFVVCDECGIRMPSSLVDFGDLDWSWHEIYPDLGIDFGVVLVVQHICNRCWPLVSLHKKFRTGFQARTAAKPAQENPYHTEYVG